MHALTDTILLSSQVQVLLLNKKIIKEILYAVITSMLTIDTVTFLREIIEKS